jgi:subtilisin-like proprotein convertase family protein
LRPHRSAALAPIIALLLTASLFAATTASAHRAPDRSNLTAAVRALVSPEKDFENLGAMRNSGGVQSQYGLDSQLLRRYWLRAPQMQAGSTLPPRQVAESFLVSHAAELGVETSRPDLGLALAYEKESPSGTHLRWNQRVGDVPVYRSEIVIKVNKKGQVSSVQNNLVPDLKLGTKPTIDAAAAIEAAKGLIKPTGRPLGEQKADLYVVPSRTGARLAWVVQLPVDEPMGDWLVFVDANNGGVIGGEDRMRYAEGTGQVFDPDPMTKMNTAYTDQNDADIAVPFPAAYDIVPLHGITLSAGTYSLSGPYVQLIDDEAPVFAPVTATHPDSFRFQRNPQGFEDVMCYYHLDNSQRYIQSLGFLNANNRVQPVDSHGLSGADNSHYVPSTGHLAFGEGGIDDDEDADVIWHEYGHSIQDNIVPGWGGGHEGAMGEGFGDYWAGSYSYFKNPTYSYNQVFTWDGNGETWTGRLLIDTAMHYPANCCGEVHDSGTLWCSGLTDCLHLIPRAAMDAIVIDHHFALGTTATMADAANQLIQSDIDLFGGAHVGILVERLGAWGFVNPADFIPSIAHIALPSTENVTGPYAVIATVTSVKPLAAGFPRLYWGFGAAITDSADMTATGNPNEFTASIPGPGVPSDIRYFIRATDNVGGTAYSPVTAPATPNLFHAGPNTTPPVITHSNIGAFPTILWPAVVTANISDDLGVNPASVIVSWALNGTPKPDFTLTRVGLTNNYSAAFPSVPADVVPGDVVTYHIAAADIATIPNVARYPSSGEVSFTLSTALGTVLVLDDDEVAKQPATKVLVDEKDPSRTTTLTTQGGIGTLSANKLAGWLTAMGYVATVEPAASSAPATWPAYSFIVAAAGTNTTALANAPYRAALEAYVAAGHKLLVEGGEVGYLAISSPGYPTFAAGVLHGATWSTDNAGPLLRLASQATHPIANTPNVLPPSIPITYVSPNYGIEDSYAPVAPAYTVYGVTTQPGNVGISVFDDDLAPQSAQVVVFAFDIKSVTDSTVAKQLVENTAHFLTAPQPAPLSTISGRVAVGTAWGGAGITVTANPGGHTTTTNPAGEFTLPNLYAATYSVSATLAGYAGSSVITTVGQAGQSNVVLRLFTQAMENVCVSPALAIPDNNAAGVKSDLGIASSFSVNDVEVAVNITHTWRGDLVVDLTHGATTVRLHNRTGSSADNIIGTYPTTLTPASPLSAFFGQPSAGTWQLFIADQAGGDVGTLNQWCLTLRGAADTTQTVGVGGTQVPTVLEFAPVFPNPSRGGNVSMSFALPTASKVRVALYDVGGRLVRTVADRAYSAGRYTLVVDGRDDRGMALRPGMYLARFSTATGTINRRFLVLQ